MKILMVMAALSLTGCAQALPAIPPAVAATGCIIEDALKGDTVAQIILDCGGDVAQVAQVFADPANAPKVAGTRAKVEMEKAKAAITGVPQS